MNHQQYDTEFFDSEAAFAAQEKPTLSYRVGHKFGTILSKLRRGTQSGLNAMHQEMCEQLNDIATELYANQENIFAEKVKKLQRRYLISGVIASFISFLSGMIIAVISLI